jgi:hypothetical protein
LQRLQVGQQHPSINLKLGTRWGQGWTPDFQKGNAKPSFATDLMVRYYSRISRDRQILQQLVKDGLINSEDLDKFHPSYQRIFALPPFHKGTASTWFKEVIWPTILRETNGQPEKDPDLYRLGRYQESRTTGTKESNVRMGISTRLCAALKSMAAPAPPGATT